MQFLPNPGCTVTNVPYVRRATSGYTYAEREGEPRLHAGVSSVATALLMSLDGQACSGVYSACGKGRVGESLFRE